MRKQKKLEFLRGEIKSHIELLNSVFDSSFLEKLIKISDLIVKSIKRGNKVLLCGNGGSAADCQHFSGEMINRFKKERKPLPFISLTTDTSVITSIGNDYKFEDIFSKQVLALGRRNDILICFSTSGESKNVIEAAKKAKGIKMTIISLTGKIPNTLEKFSDFNISVPSTHTEKVQQIHLIIYHLLCYLIEEEF
ncbi:MAG: SIS domain-containing protein [Candidatus Omnitrophica bacterium]|nr:SIS domain-containing protein [Candidatus Omnitrophota bacterium]